VRRSPRWHAIYLKLKTRLGGKKAICAIARRLLGLAFSLLKKQEPYRELPLASEPPVSRSEAARQAVLAAFPHPPEKVMT
jgi:hypothetical protein